MNLAQICLPHSHQTFLVILTPTLLKYVCFSPFSHNPPLEVKQRITKNGIKQHNNHFSATISAPSFVPNQKRSIFALPQQSACGPKVCWSLRKHSSKLRPGRFATSRQSAHHNLCKAFRAPLDVRKMWVLLWDNCPGAALLHLFLQRLGGCTSHIPKAGEGVSLKQENGNSSRFD